MWIFLNDAFLSIVEAEPGSPGLPDEVEDWLCVRARRAGDIELIFGSLAVVLEDVGTDYRYRSYLIRELVEEALRAELSRVKYSNFKDTVYDASRQRAYLAVWDRMRQMQEDERG